ncbi:MAG: hypothetical protein AAF211_10770, partial [Myxococcota bacterium]
GQTRPRTDVATVLASEVRWPGDAVADRVHALSERLERRRAEARGKLAAVQDAVDAFVAGRIDATELDRRIASVDGDTGPAGR